MKELGALFEHPYDEQTDELSTKYYRRCAVYRPHVLLLLRLCCEALQGLAGGHDTDHSCCDHGRAAKSVSARGGTAFMS